MGEVGGRKRGKEKRVKVEVGVGGGKDAHPLHSRSGPGVGFHKTDSE